MGARSTGGATGGVAAPRRALLRSGVAVMLAAGGLAVLGWQLGPALADTRQLLHFEDLAPLPTVAVPAAAWASLLVYGELHRILLVQAGGCARAATVQSVTVAGNAVSLTVPAVGSAAGPVYAVRELHRSGVDLGVASWSVGMAGVTTMAMLVVCAPLGLAVAGLVPLPVGGALGAALAVAGIALWHLTSRHHGAPHAAARTGLVGAAGRLLETSGAWVRGHRPTPRQWAVILLTAAATWALDLLALAASVAAVQQLVPWGGVVLGYLAVQASVLVKLTAGGTGTAELGLLSALVGAGLPHASAVAAVVLYRAASWLLPVLAGWVVVLLRDWPLPRSPARPD